jgi:FMN reductase
MTIRIVGLGGSLAPRSSSLAALHRALDAAAGAGALTEALDIRELDLPLYDPGLEAPPVAHLLADLVAAADGLIWSSPMYHGTISGSFKNALDWLQLLAHHERAFLTDRPVGLIAAAGGVQGLQAINTMDFVVRALRGWTLPLSVPIARAYGAFDEDGKPWDEGLDDQLTGLGRLTVDAAHRLRRESGESVAATATG